jgi:hypothetical protein
MPKYAVWTFTFTDPKQAKALARELNEVLPLRTAHVETRVVTGLVLPSALAKRVSKLADDHGAVRSSVDYFSTPPPPPPHPPAAKGA